MGSTPVVPEGFQLDPELPEGFQLDSPQAVQPPERHGEMAGRVFGGAAEGFLQAFNPVNVARAAAALAKFGGRTMLSGPGEQALALSEAVDSAKAIPGQIAAEAQTPEGAGRLLGGAAASFVPMGRVTAALGRFAGATEASRAYNVKRALRAVPGSVDARAIESMAPEITMPVTASAQKLAKGMTAARETAGAGVGAAEAALPATDISLGSVASRIEPPPGQWVMGPNDVLEFIPDNPSLMAAYRDSMRRLERAGGETGTVPVSDAIRMKRSAQSEADLGRAYTSERAGRTARSAEERATALRQELEAIPGPESEAFTRANRRFQVATTAEKPIVAEAQRLRDLPIAGRGVEMLLGRAIPGSGFARQALAGLAGGSILDSTLFHTASAAVKRSVIDALKSGQPQRATDILFRASIADYQRRKLAASALRAQAEGVTTP